MNPGFGSAGQGGLRGGWAPHSHRCDDGENGPGKAASEEVGPRTVTDATTARTGRARRPPRRLGCRRHRRARHPCSAATTATSASTGCRRHRRARHPCSAATTATSASTGCRRHRRARHLLSAQVRCAGWSVPGPARRLVGALSVGASAVRRMVGPRSGPTAGGRAFCRRKCGAPEPAHVPAGVRPTRCVHRVDPDGFVAGSRPSGCSADAVCPSRRPGRLRGRLTSQRVFGSDQHAVAADSPAERHQARRSPQAISDQHAVAADSPAERHQARRSPQAISDQHAVAADSAGTPFTVRANLRVPGYFGANVSYSAGTPFTVRANLRVPGYFGANVSYSAGTPFTVRSAAAADLCCGGITGTHLATKASAALGRGSRSVLRRYHRHTPGHQGVSRARPRQPICAVCQLCVLQIASVRDLTIRLLWCAVDVSAVRAADRVCA